MIAFCVVAAAQQNEENESGANNAAGDSYWHNEKPFLELVDSQGNKRLVPKGLFHYSESRQHLGGKMRIPNNDNMDVMNVVSDLLNTASNAETSRNSMSGIYLPMPFGMKPLSLQISSDVVSEVANAESMNPKADVGTSATYGTTSRRRKDERKLTLTPVQRSAFLQAREACVKRNQETCDRALEMYHQRRFGTSPADESGDWKNRPTDVEGVVNQGLATWFLPSLDQKLRQMSRPGTGEHVEPHSALVRQREGEDQSEEAEHNFEAERAEEELRRRRRVHLPLRQIAPPAPPPSPPRAKFTSRRMKDFLSQISA